MNLSFIRSSEARRLLLAFSLASATVLIHSLLVPVHVGAQATLAWSLVGAFFALRYAESKLANARFADVLRILLLAIGAFLSLRYLVWRSLYTISFHDPLSTLASLTLYFAELYGVTVLLLGMFLNLEPLRRQPSPPRGPRDSWPTVDVLVPSYNEAEDLLETTLLAATQIDYPHDRLRVYLCDDGGTDAKCSDLDPGRSNAARQRRASLQALCERVGAIYLTRARNLSAKAGNINAALPRTRGELILILDADHVPTEDFLVSTVGFFQKDPKLFLVQTPHFFVSADPVERNLAVFGRMPSENEMFYDQVQHGLDFWNSSFFCGSAAVLRRSWLVEAGGLSGATITEDAETALALHCRGLRSAYLNRPMIAGLQPATYATFVVQRMRWAQGMAQIFLLQNPLRVSGLTPGQRLGYLNSSFFWFFSFSRIVFLFAPAAYLIFGLRIFESNLQQFAAYALPHVAGVLLVGQLLYGKVRWAFTSELYELLQSVYTLPALMQVIANPRAPTFNVTPKGETLEDDFIAQLARPFYLIYAVAVLALITGIWRWLADADTRDATGITLGWLIFNLVLLNASLGALLERRQLRRTPRMPANRRAVVCGQDGSQTVMAQVTDLSATGAAMRLEGERPEWLRAGRRLRIDLLRPSDHRRSILNVIVRTVRMQRGEIQLGVEFAPLDLTERREIIAQVFGCSRRWERFRRMRTRPVGILQPFLILFWLGLRHATGHFVLLLRTLLVTACIRIVTLCGVLLGQISGLLGAGRVGAASHPAKDATRSELKDAA